MIEIKSIVTEMKNALHGLIFRLLKAGETISELADMTKETYKTGGEKKTGGWGPEQNIQELWENYKKYNIYMMGLPEGQEKERNRSNIWSNNGKECPQINGRHQTTDAGNSEKTK